ncbi:hypothetical protein T440DRAFT_355671, partial [Plenodomus tracheiphilus IPT5]
QYNVRKSRDMVMASLLRDPGIHDFDIIAIQESWRNPYTATTHHPAKDRFHLCYPTGDADGLPRVCFFIQLAVHNVYNPPKGTRNQRSTLPQVREALDKHRTDEQIILGDFNLHHPLWGGLNKGVTDPETEDLIDIIGDFGLHSTLPPGTVTYEEGRSRSTIDLCL